MYYHRMDVNILFWGTPSFLYSYRVKNTEASSHSIGHSISSSINSVTYNIANTSPQSWHHWWGTILIPSKTLWTLTVPLTTWPTTLLSKSVSLLDLCLTTNYFKYNQSFYRQKHGCATGSWVSPIALKGNCRC